jgi:GxxExxY protein
MPITHPFPVRSISQEEFSRLDYQAMRLAFDSQNALGRLCDEVMYQNDLAARIEAASLGQVRQQVPITVTHKDFVKVYRLDLVISDASVYELKADSALAPEHEGQLLNYLLLRGASHGKLVNFRPAQVQSRFVNANLTLASRKRIEVDARRWQEDAAGLRQMLLGLLEDWGAFLELPLYIAALIHFLGGERSVLRQVPLSRDGVSLGNQRMHLLNDQVAFRLTAMAEETDDYEAQATAPPAAQPVAGHSMGQHGPAQNSVRYHRGMRRKNKAKRWRQENEDGKTIFLPPYFCR